MIIWPAKPPTAVEVYAFEFADFLAAGETISGTPAIDAEGVTAGTPVVVGTQVQVELSAGTAGTVAKVACTIATNTGGAWPEIAVIPINGEAVSLDTAKAAQKIEDSSEDALLAGFLRAAIGHVERRTGKNLTAKIETQLVSGFPCAPKGIRLFKGPVSEIVSVAYDDSSGVEQLLTSFRLVEGSNASLLPAYNEIWPLAAFGAGSVRISYVAGYDPAELPAELTQAVILLFGHWNANREAAIASDRAAAVELPLGVEALIAPYCPPGIA